MIREDLIAERVVIDVYQRFIEHLGLKDPTTRTMFEHIKAEEEQHADELSELLFIVDPRSGEERGDAPGTDAGKPERCAAIRRQRKSLRSSSRRWPGIARSGCGWKANRSLLGSQLAAWAAGR